MQLSVKICGTNSMADHMIKRGKALKNYWKNLKCRCSLAIYRCLRESNTQTRFTSQKAELKKNAILPRKAVWVCSRSFSLIESQIMKGLRGQKNPQIYWYSKPKPLLMVSLKNKFNVIRLSPQAYFKYILFSVSKTRLSCSLFHPSLMCFSYSQSSLQ